MDHRVRCSMMTVPSARLLTLDDSLQVGLSRLPNLVVTPGPHEDADSAYGCFSLVTISTSCHFGCSGLVVRLTNNTCCPKP